MAKSKHQWATFHKGRIKVNACVSCGDLNLPSNSDMKCENSNVLNSQIFMAGYRLYQGQQSAQSN